MGNISSATEAYLKACTTPVNAALGEVSCVRMQEGERQQMEQHNELVSSYFDVDPSLLSQGLDQK
jgi:hypothetical protein